MFNYYEFKDGDNITYLELLKPNGQSLGELKNAYNRTSKLSLGEVSELSFMLPNVQEIFMQNYGSMTELEKSSLISKLGDYPQPNLDDIGKASITLIGYQVLAKYSNGLEMIFTIPNRTISSDMMKTDTSFTCYSREHELARKIIIDYKGVLIDEEYTLDALTLEEVARDLLGGTIWSIDFLDVGYNSSDTNPIRRTIDAFNNITLLAAIDNFSAIFGAIPIYDTINRTISFYRADNNDYFKYNGLLIDGNNYMNSIKEQKTTDELITRLYGIGANNLTINGVNPTGVSYIEDLSYFIYPAQLNEGKTDIVGHSKYMSDELALAELLYEEKVVDVTISFQTLYSQKDTKQSELITLENQLTSLTFELNQIQDYIDVMFVGTNTATADNAAYITKRDELDAKQSQVDDKNDEITAKEAEISDIDSQLTTLYNSLKIENNFTSEEISERQCFIYEGLYTNSGIAIASDLYDEMVEFLNKKKEPNVIIETSINNILSMKSKNANKDSNKIKIGEKIDLYYNYKGIDVDIKAQILSITIDEENNSLDLVISNTQDYKKNSSDYLENILKRSITTSTIVDNNIIDWNKGKVAVDELDNIYNQGIDAAKIQIEGASDNSVKFNERGLTILNTTEPLRFLRATNGVLALTKDGGRTYSTAITPEGIWAERLIGQILLGSELIIESSDVDTSLKISDIPAGTYSDVNSDLEAYSDDFGIVVKGPSNLIFVSRERGFKITTPTGSDVKFYADTNGNLIAKDMTINNATITGKVTATSGKIAEYTINGAQLIGANVGLSGLSGQGYAFWAGSNTPSSAPYRVGHDGSLFASNATITGTITATSGSFNGTITTGNIVATGGTIGGWLIGDVQLQKSIGNYSFEIRTDRASNEPSLLVYDGANGQYNFYVRPDGFLYARNAQISGTIYATSGSFSGSIYSSSGTIGGWTIGSTSLYSTAANVNSYLYRNGSVLFGGDNGILDTTKNTIRLNTASKLVISDQYNHTDTGDANATIGIRAINGNIRIASNSRSSLIGGGSEIYAQNGIMLNSGSGNNVYASRVGSTDSSNMVVTVGGGNPSSKIVKKNIKELKDNDYKNIYNDFKSLNLYNFDYKYKNISIHKRGFGFIIDEIESTKFLNNYLTTYNKFGKVDKNNNFLETLEKESNFKYKTWDKDNTIQMLFIIAKSLQNKIEKLEEKVNEGK